MQTVLLLYPGISEMNLNSEFAVPVLNSAIHIENYNSQYSLVILTLYIHDLSTFELFCKFYTKFDLKSIFYCLRNDQDLT